jgi:hypothetical protein
MAKFLLFGTERYALPILQPIADRLQAYGHSVATWFVDGAAGARLAGPILTVGLAEAVATEWCAVIAAANWVPPFLAGAKVQVFHGFDVEKRRPNRGHYRIRGLFDLYCTQGPSTTARFEALARKHGGFAVVETGWAKLDPLFREDPGQVEALRASAGARPIVLFASTFSRRLSAAPRLLDVIAAEVRQNDRFWLLTLHPKCPSELVDAYRRLVGSNARYVEAEEIPFALRAADVLLADTTSVTSEFAVLGKPVITFRNAAPKPYMFDFDDPSDLPRVVNAALAGDPDRVAATAAYAAEIHPYRDGASADRVIKAIEALIAGRLGHRRLRWVDYVRGLWVRAHLGYWGWATLARSRSRIHARSLAAVAGDTWHAGHTWPDLHDLPDGGGGSAAVRCGERVADGALADVVSADAAPSDRVPRSDEGDSGPA